MMGVGKRKVLIIGPFGQDGQIISRLLLNKQTSIYGIAKDKKPEYIQLDGINYIFGNLSDHYFSTQILEEIKPDVIIHLAAKHGNSITMSSIEANYSEEILSTGSGILVNLIDWLKKHPNTKLLVALSSFMYSGNPTESLITINSVHAPKGVYGEIKVKMHQMLTRARQDFGIDVCGMILFNHTSTFSKPGFLIPDLALKIRSFVDHHLEVLNIEHSNKLVDISNAWDFCEGMIAIIESSHSRDFIFSSGNLISIKSIVENTISQLNPSYLSALNFLPSTDNNSIPIYGDISETIRLLNWKPTISISTTLAEMSQIA
jgi:GDP-D-mannose dehydratase